MSQFESNLSEGSVARRLIVFALPVLLSNIVQSLYSVKDMWRLFSSLNLHRWIMTLPVNFSDIWNSRLDSGTGAR